MAKIKGNGEALTHQEMDSNFTELTEATTRINNQASRIAALEATVNNYSNRIAALETTVSGIGNNNFDPTSLQNQITALQTELDTNQQSAENITNGVISRLNITRAQFVTFRSSYTSLGSADTGVAELNTLLDTIVQALLDEIDSNIADIDAQITLFSEDFTI
jgi:chromosome segregation ATPase